ncbi:putative NodB-like protein [Seiridium cardinale]
MAFRSVIGIVVFSGSILTFAFLQYVHSQREASFLEKVLRPLSFLLLVNFLWMTLRWKTYKPQVGLVDDGQLPLVDVVIPVYNESSFIKESVKSVLCSDYPRDKVHLIIVDDGSTDDTWYHIGTACDATLEAKIKCTVKRHETNGGKRQALVTGIKQGNHEVLVTLDSDSVLTPATLRNIVTPLVMDSTVGGVAGHLSVANTGNPEQHSWRTLIPRLLHILFQYGGNIPRSAQTKSGFVVILPGAISAFRRKYISPHIDELTEQWFLGHPLRHGEDIELTMKLLQAGWRTVYQSNAISHTKAPETAYKALLMYIRWERSSYTYLLRGLMRLTFSEARHQLKNVIFSSWKGSGFLPTAYQPLGQAANSMADHRHVDLFPILNLTCTSFSSVTYIGIVVLRLVALASEPRIVATDLFCMVLFGTWISLLLIPDALRDDSSVTIVAKSSKDEEQEVGVTHRDSNLPSRFVLGRHDRVRNLLAKNCNIGETNAVLASNPGLRQGSALVSLV